MVHEDLSSDGTISDAMMYQIVETSAGGDSIALSSHPQILRTVPQLKTQQLRFPQTTPGTSSSDIFYRYAKIVLLRMTCNRFLEQESFLKNLASKLFEQRIVIFDTDA